MRNLFHQSRALSLRRSEWIEQHHQVLLTREDECEAVPFDQRGPCCQFRGYEVFRVEHVCTDRIREEPRIEHISRG